jgi:hypothetical protein
MRHPLLIELKEEEWLHCCRRWLSAGAGTPPLDDGFEATED